MSTAAPPARFIGLVTGRTGEDLLILQAAVEAHSRKEKELSAILQKYHPQDMDRALTIAQLLKDADGLDRVRIWDLDVRFLRRTSSTARRTSPRNCTTAISPSPACP